MYLLVHAFAEHFCFYIEEHSSPHINASSTGGLLYLFIYCGLLLSIAGSPKSNTSGEDCIGL